MCTRSRTQRGLSLVEQIVFIVIVGVAIGGVLAAMNVTARGSADPLIQKQALAIAEAVMEEVQLMPLTYCDPDDPVAATATSSAGCATPEGIGVEGAETRTGAILPFDNVSDYNGFSMTGITDITGAGVAGLGAYTASVQVAQQALDVVPATDALLVTVTVAGPGNTSVVLHGFRTRYAPNALP